MKLLGSAGDLFGKRIGVRVRGLAIAAVVAALLVAAPASSAGYAPLDHPGPALSVPRATLMRALACNGVKRGGREPILLVPGTTLTPPANFSWNYERALAARGFPYCTVELPNHAMSDVQVSAEYVVFAIRQAHRRSGRKVQIIGYSQGGMVPRWALRFWPGTRAMVDDDVGLDASNHGTLDAYGACGGGCAPSIWQQETGSHFLAALNSRQETFSGVSYTEIYSHSDEVVVPNLNSQGSSSVHGGGGRIENVAVQDVCPTDSSDHLAMGTYDAVGYALAIDAVTHSGPADPARIDRSVCAQPFQPGVNPATFPTDYANMLAVVADEMAGYPHVAAEPPLDCYVFADCRRPGRHRRAHTRRRRHAGQRPSRPGRSRARSSQYLG